MEGINSENYQLGEFTQLNIESYLKFPGLVIQKSKFIKDLKLTTKTGETLDIHKDGCMMVSLYNSLVIHGYKHNFEEFINNLVLHDCIRKDGSLVWAAFNNSNTGHTFRWMQDNEIKNCDEVNINDLGEWTVAGHPALVKVQSVFFPWKRHYMVALAVDGGSVECLESSAIDGKLKLRTISENDILGVRYFELKRDDQQNQSSFSQVSPF